MQVKELAIKNFRNYEEETVTFNKGVNFIYGANGSGKTNLVEAIYFLSLSRSFKRCSDSDLIRKGQDKAEIRVTYEIENGEEKGEHTIGAIITPNGKTFYIDQEKVPQVSRVLGKMLAISFDPGVVFLFRQDPMERRRFLDETLGSVSKGYLYTLGRYKKILRERNFTFNRPSIDEDVLRVLTDELVTSAYILSRQRRILVTKLQEKAAKIFKQLEPEKSLKISYISNLPDEDDQEMFRNKTKALFEASRSEERLKKYTLIGVHRDDLEAEIEGESLSSYCSQGQNRVAIFALKMAVAELIEELKNEAPIMILDDVLSDLDATKCQKILDFLKGDRQSFVTVADITKVKDKDNYVSYEINSNKVVRRMTNG